MTRTVLSLRDISVSYGKAEAVRNVSLDISAGSIVTVIGANGAGKSTLLNAAMGVVRGEGRIQFDGADCSDEPVETRVMAGMSLVPERRELFSTMSVEDNLTLGAFRAKVTRGEKADRLARIYDRFKRLGERRHQLAGTLSGGERQMLAMGRALMIEPKLLMLDEPSLGLAPLIVKDIFRIIVELRSTGVSILLVEQNARAALEVADYAYVMETGSVTLEGRAADLIHDRRVVASYLGLREAVPA
ncbi:ABC transporter ATP-binding protein [Kaistia dalseonensis]|uniref:Branched-chain amino acid transport system ATP-binding protein n=1 Tax=Kaistia dalseonensis TaxID=410840 RepID=A0ABU0H8P4_9HYPH|nr:ABC transporter ATP-binding protein [Kaistia dalseonensis]MCX5495538.1 ABC transporter ATP-binding protein [Kaistia dalseonensis]MDQ0438130.1 branched-chain amino acid transport system ATP-binding protein [Kaistia dalseonensis]